MFVTCTNVPSIACFRSSCLCSLNFTSGALLPCAPPRLTHHPLPPPPLHPLQCVDSGKEINLHYAVKARIITDGLKYSVSTGNWGQANQAGTRAGVSQVGAWYGLESNLACVSLPRSTEFTTTRSICLRSC